MTNYADHLRRSKRLASALTAWGVKLEELQGHTWNGTALSPSESKEFFVSFKSLGLILPDFFQG